MKKSHLPEILACIVVLLALVLFARWWKRGSDRSSCIINIRNTQQAVRGHLGMSQSKDFADFTSEKMRKVLYTGPDAYLHYPICPSGGTYTLHDLPSINPPLGFVFLTCSCAKSHNHKPDDTADW